MRVSRQQQVVELHKVLAKIPFTGYIKVSEESFPISIIFDQQNAYFEIPTVNSDSQEAFLRFPDENPSRVEYRTPADLEFIIPAVCTFSALMKQAQNLGLANLIHPCAHSIGITLHNPDNNSKILRLRFLTPYDQSADKLKPKWIITPDTFFVNTTKTLAEFEAPTRPQDVNEHAAEMLNQLAEFNRNPLTFDPFNL
jgi:hypothetical protein